MYGNNCSVLPIINGRASGKVIIMKLKRIFALLIAAVMMISLAAVNVSAAKTTKGVTLNKTSASVTAGKYITLKPTVTGYKKYTLVWSTSNKDVATVTSGGKVTGKRRALPQLPSR